MIYILSNKKGKAISTIVAKLFPEQEVVATKKYATIMQQLKLSTTTTDVALIIIDDDVYSKIPKKVSKKDNVSQQEHFLNSVEEADSDLLIFELKYVNSKSAEIPTNNQSCIVVSGIQPNLKNLSTAINEELDKVYGDDKKAVNATEDEEEEVSTFLPTEDEIEEERVITIDDKFQDLGEGIDDQGEYVELKSTGERIYKSKDLELSDEEVPVKPTLEENTKKEVQEETADSNQGDKLESIELPTTEKVTEDKVITKEQVPIAIDYKESLNLNRIIKGLNEKDVEFSNLSRYLSDIDNEIDTVIKSGAPASITLGKIKEIVLAARLNTKLSLNEKIVKEVSSILQGILDSSMTAALTAKEEIEEMMTKLEESKHLSLIENELEDLLELRQKANKKLYSVIEEIGSIVTLVDSVTIATQNYVSTENTTSNKYFEDMLEDEIEIPEEKIYLQVSELLNLAQTKKTPLVTIMKILEDLYTSMYKLREVDSDIIRKQAELISANKLQKHYENVVASNSLKNVLKIFTGSAHRNIMTVIAATTERRKNDTLLIDIAGDIYFYDIQTKSLEEEMNKRKFPSESNLVISKEDFENINKSEFYGYLQEASCKYYNIFINIPPELVNDDLIIQARHINLYYDLEPSAMKTNKELLKAVNEVGNISVSTLIVGAGISKVEIKTVLGLSKLDLPIKVYSLEIPAVIAKALLKGANPGILPEVYTNARGKLYD